MSTYFDGRMSSQWLKKIFRRFDSTGRQENGSLLVGDEYLEDRRQYQKRRRRELRDPSSPPFLPLERPLRLQCTDDTDKSTPISDQIQSLLMQTPAEIRSEIYAALLADCIVHLWYGFWPGNWRGGRTSLNSGKALPRKRGRSDLPDQWNFYHSVCPEDRHFAPVAAHWHWVWLGSPAHCRCQYGAGVPTFEPYDTQKLFAMPLLLTCKKMYSEFVDILYSRLTFSAWMIYHYRTIQINVPDAILTPLIFARLFTPQNFQRITSLDLEWNLTAHEQHRDGLTFDPARYTEWWNVILSMNRLRKLRLMLNMQPPPSPITDYCCEVFNEPIEKMREKDLDEFHIAAPEPYFRIFRRIADPPCTFSFLNYLHLRCNFDSTRPPFLEGTPPYDDGGRTRGRHDGVYFPISDKWLGL